MSIAAILKVATLADSSLDRLFDLLFKVGFDARNLVAERHFKVRVT